MALVMPRQKHHRQARYLTNAQRTGRLAPRTRDVLLAHIVQPRQIENAGANR